MAKYWLINTVSFANSGKHLPGDVVDDTIENVQQYINAGAVLWPFADSIVAAAGAKCQVSRMSKAINEQDLFNIMSSACSDSVLLSNSNKSPNVSQATWYIKPVGGNDNASGKTASSALKTWKELQTRLGLGSTLTPTGGLLEIFILGNLPLTDPVTWDFTLAPGALANVRGKLTEMGSGTLTATDKDRSTNTPFKIAANGKPADYWADKEGMILVNTTSGARSIVGSDLNLRVSPPEPATAQVPDWIEWYDGNPGAYPGADSCFPSFWAVTGDSFKVYDCSEIYLSYIDHKGSQIETGPKFSGVNFINLKLKASPSQYCTIQAQGFQTISFKECQKQVHADVFGTSVGFGNCSLQARNDMHEGDMLYAFGCSHPYLQPDIYNFPGAIEQVSPAGKIRIFGDHAFIGDLDSGFYPADIGAKQVEASVCSFWRCFHGIVLNAGGDFRGLGHDNVTGEEGYPAFWGAGNVATIYMFAGSKLRLDQFLFDVPVATPYVLPTLETAETQPIASSSSDAGAPEDNREFYPWDRTAVAYAPLVASNWTNFTVATPAGFKGFVFDDSGPWGAYRSVGAEAHRVESGGAFVSLGLNIFDPA